MTAPGVATLILHANAAWGDAADSSPLPVLLPNRPMPEPGKFAKAAAALRGGRRTAVILGGKAMRARALEWAGKIATMTGAELLTQRAARWERGAGRAPVRPVPYNVDLAEQTFREFETVILIGGISPVAFFAYPGKPRWLLAEGCEVIELVGVEHDLPAVLEALADNMGARYADPTLGAFTAADLAAPTDSLDARAISAMVARALPEGTIICEEALTSAGNLAELALGMAPHDRLPLTGGSIGIGIPLSVGAAIAASDRKVVTLQADGSGMYRVQGPSGSAACRF